MTTTHVSRPPDPADRASILLITGPARHAAAGKACSGGKLAFATRSGGWVTGPDARRPPGPVGRPVVSRRCGVRARCRRRALQAPVAHRARALEPGPEALLADDAALHHRLLFLREADVPEEISALRVFDVIGWMDGKNRGLSERSDLKR
ncbi:DUF6308 family protein [Rhodococcus sp. NPDC127530]|uniref:DUF6308 family protein n=1 Tax=unclassified Rhodococcus (in: high G+C Gram-positive bacteria) TaxID=192944 RepID=UPI003626C728